MIYLLRHGEIKNANQKRFIGQTDCELSAEGRAQAEFWRDVFARIDLRSILCSDLKRSRETGMIISGGRTEMIRVEAGLREIHLGDWEGRVMSEVKASSPLEWQRRGEDLANYRPSGGESFSDLLKRVAPVFDEFTGAARKGVLIVGHAGVNRVLLCRLLGMPLGHLFRLGQDYGRLNMIQAKTDGFRVLGVNWPPEAFPGDALSTDDRR